MAAHTAHHFDISGNRDCCPFWCAPTIVTLLFAASFLCCTVASSQHPLTFDRITQRDGLSSPSVFTICQDVSGAMWFGSDEGVERYDGFGFRTFEIGGAYALLADERGYVWVGSPTEGIFSFDIANDTLISMTATVDDPNRELHKRVSSLHLDREGILWVGLTRGLARFDTKKRSYVSAREPSVPNRSVNSIVDDRAGNLWLGTCCGIVKFEKRTGRSTEYQYDLGSTARVNMAFDQVGRLWINGGRSAGLVCFDTTHHEWSTFLCNGVPPNASNVLVDDAGRVWVCTATDGLKIFDPRTGGWEEYHNRSSDPQSLTSDCVGGIYRDKAGNIWLGTRNGVSKLARWRKQFRAIPHNTDDSNSPPKVPIRSISEDREGNLWIASWGGGVRVWNRQTGVFTSVPGIGPYVNVVLADRSGWVWMGTANPDGVTAFKPSTGQARFFRHGQNDTLSIPSGPVLSLYEDPDGTIWVGTKSFGLGRIVPRTGKCRRVKPLIDPCDQCAVKGFYRDRTGRLWASVYEMLVEVIGKGERSRALLTRGRLQIWERAVTAMYEDGEGRFYIGTHGGFGLLDRKTGMLTYLRRDDRRFQGAATYGIIDDDRGNLWLMTAKGVSLFDTQTKEFTDFGNAEGFPSVNLGVNTVNGTSSFCRTRDGFLVLGTGEGIVIFHPDSLHRNPNPPGVLITKIAVAGIPAPLRLTTLATGKVLEVSPIEVLYSQNNVTFEYAALEYTAPSLNAFAHKLEGLEDSWSPVSRNRRAEYVNLSPGSYVFRVKASNNDGVWNEKGAFVRITVLPPWWMTWWFRALAVLAGIGILVLTVRLRIRRVVAQERIRWQIAGDLHDDVGSSLSSIALVSENVRNALGDSHPAHRELNAVTLAARQAAERLKDDVWVIKPGADSLESLLLKMKDASREVIGPLALSFRADPNRDSRQVPLAFRRNVLFIYKEALHNIVKHSGASSVEVVVELADGFFDLDVRDDGKGFDGEVARKGNGLFNMRARAAALKGDIVIHSEIDRGTHIHLRVRIP